MVSGFTQGGQSTVMSKKGVDVRHSPMMSHPLVSVWIINDTDGFALSFALFCLYKRLRRVLLSRDKMRKSEYD